MRNIKLIIEYDGTNYCGFQIQENGVTIQGELEKALLRITKTATRIIGASRTDAGVHAFGQTVNFFTNLTMPAAKFVPALNSLLPPTIVVKQAVEVPASFHAQYDALGKTYCYTIDQSPVPSAFNYRYAYFLPDVLDLVAMQAGLKLLVGEHNYRAFCGANSRVQNYVRRLSKVELVKRENLLQIYITGTGFLYNMVRIIVGTIIEVGKGKLTPEQISDILASQDRTRAGPTAPAHGLCLVKVYYAPEKLPGMDDAKFLRARDCMTEGM